jgi:biotin synthase
MITIDDLLLKSRDEGVFLPQEIIQMLSFPPDSAESYRLMAESSAIAKKLIGNRAEVHAQFALNLAPCNCNCVFCSFAESNGIFSAETRVTAEEAVGYARQFEADGANAIFVMTTALYPFELFLEMSSEIRRHLKPETMMIANVGDQNALRARQIREAGYTGVYHALRLREGSDTGLSPKARLTSIRNFLDAGLEVGTCVEPVGPEHTNQELAESILFTASFNPVYSGAARRIAIPGTESARRGMITELRMAQIVAVTRIAMPRSVPGNCTHEPCAPGAMAGATLFWAEVGANPRDIKEKTEEGRGDTVQQCRDIFRESGWDCLEGPSCYYGRATGLQAT